MLHINWHPDDRQIRHFGLVSLAALPLAVAVWTRGSISAVAWAAAAGGILAAIAVAWPRGLRPLLVAINVITAPLALVLHDMVLLLAFGLVIVPAGLFMRLAGRDPLQLKINRSAGTYWQPKSQPRDVRSYFRRW